MKKTVIINISGIVFNIDEDAYDKLQLYLNDLTHYFGAKPEAKEIIQDIESRIAELLQPKLSESKQVINIQDVEEIINILGTPEVIAGANDDDFEDEQGYRSQSRKTNRRLYRDPDNRMLGGVCSGLGAYFGIDPVIFRLLFVILVFVAFVSFIIYIILWIVVPKAKTAAQRLEMHGENVTIGNIERTFREGTKHLSENTHSLWNKIAAFLNEVFSLLGTLLRGIGTFLRITLGLILIVTSLAFIVSIIAGLFLNDFVVTEITADHFSSLRDFLTYFIEPANIDMLLILSLITIALPVAGLIYAGLKLLVRFKAQDRWVILSLLIFWIISIIGLSIYIFDEVRNFRHENNTIQRVELKKPDKKVLYITAPGIIDEDYHYLKHSNLFGVTNKKELYGMIEIDIEKSSAAIPELEIISEARGRTRTEALESAKQIVFKYQQNDTLLNISPVFYLSKDQRWKFQRVKVILHLPESVKVHLNENTRHLLHDVDVYHNHWIGDMLEKPLLMSDEGLRYDYVAHSNPVFQKTIVVKLRSANIPKELNARRRTMVFNTDSGRYLIGIPVISFKAWDKDYIKNENRIYSTGGSPIYFGYGYKLEDSVLFLNPVWRYNRSYILKNRILRPGFVTFYIPEGTKIYFSPEVRMLFSGDGWRVDRTWLITKRGLEEVVNE